MFFPNLLLAQAPARCFPAAGCNKPACFYEFPEDRVNRRIVGDRSTRVSRRPLVGVVHRLVVALKANLFAFLVKTPTMSTATKPTHPPLANISVHHLTHQTARVSLVTAIID